MFYLKKSLLVPHFVCNGVGQCDAVILVHTTAPVRVTHATDVGYSQSITGSILLGTYVLSGY